MNVRSADTDNLRTGAKLMTTLKDIDEIFKQVFTQAVIEDMNRSLWSITCEGEWINWGEEGVFTDTVPYMGLSREPGIDPDLLMDEGL